MTGSTAIFWPMIAHVFLVYCIYYLLSKNRRKAVEQGSASEEQFRSNQVEPEQSQFARNNLENQFELPVLFHAGCLALYVTGAATIGPVILAWIFVAARYAHSFIHIRTNHIPHRRPLFIISFVANGILWAWLAVHLAVN
ncbi:MAPEG family protein [Rhizobium alvei]|uniref:MAPEG family protein n=1 Tax=Rhizobium alvei TaxID=1132659 RepID=A0ABT8YN40_9HYPH|nr:MAPEG family protein [Rhizobium alvei]MDO6965145.1 MAPEG family protein [Rhizobium alvei]